MGPRRDTEQVRPLLEDGPIRRFLRERPRLYAQRGAAEEVIQKWREKGVPESAIDLAMKMADRWLKAVTK